MVIKVLNLDKCIAKFGNIRHIDLMPEIREAARKVQRKARDVVPVITGTLKGSIFTKSYPTQQSAVVYTLTEYAPYVEFGTRFSRPKPFLGRAMREERAGINQSMKKYIKEQLAKKT